MTICSSFLLRTLTLALVMCSLIIQGQVAPVRPRATVYVRVFDPFGTEIPEFDARLLTVDGLTEMGQKRNGRYSEYPIWLL
jgi:hypothetical protein